MSHAAAHFAQTYAEARAGFLAAAADCRLPVQSLAHPLAGMAGEPLALDVARFGSPDAQALLLVSSACRRRGGALPPRPEPLGLFLVAPRDP